MAQVLRVRVPASGGGRGRPGRRGVLLLLPRGRVHVEPVVRRAVVAVVVAEAPGGGRRGDGRRGREAQGVVVGRQGGHEDVMGITTV